VARELADRYGGDRASATWNHLSKRMTNTEELLVAAGTRLERERAIARATPPPEPFVGPPGPPVAELIEQYRAQLAAIKQAHPEYEDENRLDWTILRRLIRRHPGASRDDLIAVLVAASPNIEERKRSGVYGYAALTVDKIMGKRTIYERDAQPPQEGSTR
jgi:hypothetical protein